MTRKPFFLIFRLCLKNKVYFITNVIGLSIALTVTLLIYSFVVKEMQTDHFHQNGKNIYRIITKGQHFSDHYESSQAGPLASALQSRISGIASSVRIWPSHFNITTDDRSKVHASVKTYHSDYTFFEVFSFPLLAGKVDRHSPKNWAVLSEKSARQFFGDQNPIGKTIYISDYGWFSQPQIYQVVAVMKNFPAWSTLQTDIVLDYSERENHTAWHMNYSTANYLLIGPDVPIADIEKAMQEIYHEIYPSSEGEIKLQPFHHIYYNPENTLDFEAGTPHGSWLFTRILIGITVLILFLCSCNYMMIKIAQGHYALKIFALQRCFGAANKHLTKSLLIETCFYFFVSGIPAILLTIALHPTFQNIISPKFHYSFPVSWQSILSFLAFAGIFVLFISFMLNHYFLKKLNAKGIKGSLNKPKGYFDIRKILAFVSITIFCLLLFDAGIVYKQMNFIKHKELGFDSENILEVFSYNGIKAKLLDNPDIINVSSGGSALPFTGSGGMTIECFMEGDVTMDEKVELFTGDADYLETFRIELTEGTVFDPAQEPRNSGIIPVLVNQQFVKHARLSNPLGTIFKGKLNTTLYTFSIIGVMKDFHFRPLYQSLSPLIMTYAKGSHSCGVVCSDIASVRYRPGKKAEVLKFLQANDIRIISDYQNSFLYEKEEAFIRLINFTTLITILISGLGIFSFALFFTNSRKKEVALRKINGADAWDIQYLFNREFILLTMGGCLVSFPAAYLLIRVWLERFAYRTSIDWIFFIGTAAACLLFVILVVSWQIRQAVRTNPVEFLKEL